MWAFRRSLSGRVVGFFEIHCNHGKTAAIRAITSLASIKRQECVGSARTSRHPLDLTTTRSLSEWTQGTDLLADSLAFGQRPKIVLEAVSPTGFDVSGLITRVSEEEDKTNSGSVHMNGSILVTNHCCLLWKPTCIEEVTLDSLAPVLLMKPKLEYLFLGASDRMKPEKMRGLQQALRKHGIVVEQLSVANAMGTFNILNGEDRLVAAALLLDPPEQEDDDDEGV